MKSQPRYFGSVEQSVVANNKKDAVKLFKVIT